MNPLNSTPAPWPTMRGNPQNTGCWDFNQRVHEGALIWRRAEAGGIVNATPIVDTTGTVHVGSSDGYLYSMAGDGEWTWVPIAAGDSDKRAVVDSAACHLPTQWMYVPAGNRSLYGSRADEPLARFELDKQPSSPSTIDWLEGNVVTDGNGGLYAGCDNFFFYALRADAQGASKRWAFATGFFIWSAAAFHPDGTMGCFAAADMTVYAFDPRSDAPKILWTAPLDNLCASSPAITRDGRVMLGAFDGRIYCLDAQQLGHRIATVDTPALIYASPALYEQGSVQQMFVLSSDGVLRAFDIAERNSAPRLLWACFTGMPSFSSPVVGPAPDGQAGYRVYVATGDGVVLSIDPKHGDVIGEFDLCRLDPQEEGASDDPAFWTSVQYPAINASLALSAQGVVAVSSGGIVARIPYGAFVAPTARDPRAGLRYVSPAGRMAAKAVDSYPSIPVDGGQVLTLASVSAQGFEPLQAAQLSVTLGGQIHPFSLSADGTLIHLQVPLDRSPFTVSVHYGDALYGSGIFQMRAIASPPQASTLPGKIWDVTRMSVFAPFVVPALDQLAIATITLSLRVLHVGQPDDTGTCPVTVYGCERYAGGEGGSPVRNLMYLFTGSYRDGVLVLEARDTYFELSALPVGLDTFRLTAVLNGTQVRGVSLSATYRKSFWTTMAWLSNLVHKWLANTTAQDATAPGARTGPEANAPLNSLQTTDTVSVGWRVAAFAMRLLRMGMASLLRPWKLLDANGAFVWAGTYGLSVKGSKKTSVTVNPAQCSFRWPYLHVHADGCAQSSDTCPVPQDQVIGIVLWDADTQEPLDLPYTTLNEVPVNRGTSVTCTLLWDDVHSQRVGWNRRLIARVMVGTEIAHGEFAFQMPEAVQR
ncbi:outer membrane protein assembly factor BamB family protein [Acidovorax sp. BL-A-41-H1]|uniref:outer membrane protein assembly factor BamB family protein n=1 Tax=Acidovorax sp. BL-A-41-H1 TaxID=3421102 RepID=UPI003F793CAD